MDKRDEFAFAASQRDFDMSRMPMPSMDDLYRNALNSRENKRATYQTALNAALENLLSWERVARADGFRIETLSDAHNGSPHPVFEGDKVTFVQAYGVRVVDRLGEK